jgi:hypothetical protein
MASASYAVNITKNIDENTKKLQLQYFSQSTTSKDKNPICVSTNTSNLVKESSGTENTMQTCKFNAIQRFASDEAEQKKNMRKMNALFGLAYRSKNDYVNMNTTAFSDTNFVLPSGKSTTLYDNKSYVFNYPSGSVSSMKVTVGDDTRSYSVEFFGYIIVSATNGVSNVKPSVTVNNTVSKIVSRVWIGDSAVANYVSETAAPSTLDLYNDEIYPIRVQVSLTNSKNMNKFVVSLSMSTTDKKDKIGLYTFVEGNNKLYVMKKYFYALEQTSTGALNCYTYSSNTMPTDGSKIKYVLKEFTSIDSSMLKKKENDVTLKDDVKTNTSKKSTATLTIGKTKYTIDYTGLKLIQNSDWLSKSISNGGDKQYLSDSTPIYGTDGTMMITYDSNKKKIVVTGYILNPKCSSSNTSQSVLNLPNVKQLQSMADMYNTQVLEYNNTYILNDISRNVVQPINTIKTGAKVMPEFSTKSSDADQWNSTAGFYPANIQEYKKAPSTENTSTKCLKYSAEKKASTAFFVTDSSKKTNECYYNTKAPADGEYSNSSIRVVAPASKNISSTMYIRNKVNPDTKKMISSATNIGYLNDVYQPVIEQQEKWLAVAGKPVEKFSGYERFSGRESFVEGATDYLTAASRASKEYSELGKVDVTASSNMIAELDSKLQTLQSLASNERELIKYGNNPENNARALYDIVHPNSTKSAVDGHKQDEEELRLQYNNLFMVGSIAAATFSIAAIVTLTFSK